MVIEPVPGAPGRTGRVARLLGYTAAFLALSWLSRLAPPRAVDLFALMIFWSYFCSTAIILCDEITSLFEGRSLLAQITACRSCFFSFLAVGAASGVLLDGTAQWIGKLWVYPYWTAELYAATFVPGFCAYWLLLAETYAAAKVLLSRAGLAGRAHEASRSRNRPVARITGACGAALAGAGLLLAGHDFVSAGGYRFEVVNASPGQVSFACFPLIFAGVWLMLEYLEYRGGKPSLLEAVLRRDWLPLCAILTASTGFGIFMESVNTAYHFWRYINWPLQHVQVLGIPVMVILLWPLQYVVFLSIANVMGGDALREDWR